MYSFRLYCICGLCCRFDGVIFRSGYTVGERDVLLGYGMFCWRVECIGRKLRCISFELRYVDFKSGCFLEKVIKVIFYGLMRLCVYMYLSGPGSTVLYFHFYSFNANVFLFFYVLGAIDSVSV